MDDRPTGRQDPVPEPGGREAAPAEGGWTPPPPSEAQPWLRPAPPRGPFPPGPPGPGGPGGGPAPGPTGGPPQGPPPRSAPGGAFAPVHGPVANTLALALVAALLGGIVGGAIVARARPASRTVVRTFSANTSRLAKPQDVQSVLARVEPATVSIRTQAFQGGDLSGAGPVVGAGTGMIITADGEVLTNNHVVAGATSIKVSVFGQSSFQDADLLGADPVDDVALVKIRGAKAMPTVELGDSDKAQVGDDVLAIGNALALAGGPTVTEGIISAKDRTVPAGNETLEGMIQTDAAINPGNSGGPLVNAQGQVIGMNTAVATGSPGEPAQNVGFAIPVNRIKPLLPALRQGRAPLTSTTFLGAGLVTLTPELRQQYGFTPDSGAVVGQVVPGSPADSAGLQVGDVVTSFDGQAVDSAEKLRSLIRSHKPGDRVALEFVRGAARHGVTVVLGSRPSSGP